MLSSLWTTEMGMSRMCLSHDKTWVKISQIGACMIQHGEVGAGHEGDNWMVLSKLERRRVDSRKMEGIEGGPGVG